MKSIQMPWMLVVAVLFSAGCQNTIEKAGRNAGYSAYELVGIEKRDLLKRRVNTARDEQKEATESYQSALDRMKSMYNFDGGRLEKEYRALNSAYEESERKSRDVRLSVHNVETVAGDLFAEWEKEIKDIQTASLRAKSQKTLADTKVRYENLHRTLKAAESRMDPILAKLKDQVLYLKHNLNAKAIASLKGEATTIQNDISSLIAQMQKSIDAADKFIKEMENES
ncbi:MAG: DUF2959 domain-containing protein [Bdellovibrionaceae bacterium]|nr:DUF2959 domain-containing protein [Pseudobdellovibrionaceae bacterium]MBX3032750.1 DUF2959 domain-containing protein [Pseudobdellovibrionaceae bacterium]